MQSIVR
jgi:hypothetical protein